MVGIQTGSVTFENNLALSSKGENLQTFQSSISMCYVLCLTCIYRDVHDGFARNNKILKLYRVSK